MSSKLCELSESTKFAAKGSLAAGSTGAATRTSSAAVTAMNNDGLLAQRLETALYGCVVIGTCACARALGLDSSSPLFLVPRSVSA